MNTKLINLYRNLSFIGFVGLAGIAYFVHKNIESLFYFAYLSFFCFFFIYKHLQKGIDERTLENLSKSNRVTATVALMFLFLLGFIPVFVLNLYGTKCDASFFILGASIGTFCTIIAQIASFFYFEKH